MVQRLASSVADCETGNSSRLAARGLEGVLEVAILWSSKGGSPDDPGRASSSHRTHGFRAFGVKGASRPSWQGWGFRFPQGPWPNICEGAAARPQQGVARVPDAACNGHVGLRLFLRPTADWAAQQIVEYCVWDHAPPRFLIRQPLWCVPRPSRAGRWNTASSHAVQVAPSQCNR
jgi:hypothetical protein